MITGTFERFIGILIEHYAGRFPPWLAPLQAAVTTTVSDADLYEMEIVSALQAAGVRVVADTWHEEINLKVREHSVHGVPMLVVVGRRESELRRVAVRSLNPHHGRPCRWIKPSWTSPSAALRRTWRGPPADRRAGLAHAFTPIR